MKQMLWGIIWLAFAAEAVSAQDQTITLRFRADKEPLRFDSVEYESRVTLPLRDTVLRLAEDPKGSEIEVAEIEKSFQAEIQRAPEEYRKQLQEDASRYVEELAQGRSKLLRKELLGLVFRYVSVSTEAEVRGSLEQAADGTCSVKIPRLPDKMYWKTQVTGEKGGMLVYVVCTQDAGAGEKTIELPRTDASLTGEIVNVSESGLPGLSLTKELFKAKGIQALVQIVIVNETDASEARVSLSGLPALGNTELFLRKSDRFVKRFVEPLTWFVDVPKENRLLRLDFNQQQHIESTITRGVELKSGANSLGKVEVFQLVYPFSLRLRLGSQDLDSHAVDEVGYLQLYQKDMDWKFEAPSGTNFVWGTKGYLPRRGEYTLKISGGKIKTAEGEKKIKPVETTVKVTSREENVLTIPVELEQ